MNMRTDEFIRLLTSDRNAPSLSVGRQLAAAVLIGFSIAAAAFMASLGPRADIAAAAETPRFIFKIVEALLLAGTASILALRMIRPGTSTRAAGLAMLAVPILLATAVAIELSVVPSARWRANLIGGNSIVCIVAIPLLSLPLLGSALYALRQGAPTRPVLTGAVAGMLAGGLAAALYATQCTDDSPLFVATWYSLAIAAVSLVGAASGRWLLRW